jgi:hypothetical protein
VKILMRKDLADRGDTIPFTTRVAEKTSEHGVKVRWKTFQVTADQVLASSHVSEEWMDDDGRVWANNGLGRGWFYSADLDFEDDMHQGLWGTLMSIEKIHEISREISDHNYLDSTTIDLCRDIEIEIRDLFTILKEEAPKFHREYIEAKAQAIAEEMHP